MIKNPTYRFYIFSHKRADESFSTRIAAVSSFAGQTVKGYADCHPGDNFDLEFGKALAAARCNERIAEKRCKRAYDKVDEAKAQMDAAITHFKKMQEYERDAEANYNAASLEVATLLSSRVGSIE